MKLVIDTNVFISALIRDGMTRKLIVKSPVPLIFPEIILHEVRTHKDEIIKKTGLREEDYYTLQKKLLQYVEIVPTEALYSKKQEAYAIVKSIDKDDVLFVAAALAYAAPLWSDDKQLKLQSTVRVLNTSEIMRLFTR